MGFIRVRRHVGYAVPGQRKAIKNPELTGGFEQETAVAPLVLGHYLHHRLARFWHNAAGTRRTGCHDGDKPLAIQQEQLPIWQPGVVRAQINRKRGQSVGAGNRAKFPGFAIQERDRYTTNLISLPQQKIGAVRRPAAPDHVIFAQQRLQHFARLRDLTGRQRCGGDWLHRCWVFHGRVVTFLHSR